jgi:hypothetical protein
MIIERPEGCDRLERFEPFMAIVGLRWRWNCPIDQGYLSSGENHWRKSTPRKHL